jgi:hypothetical protein
MNYCQKCKQFVGADHIYHGNVPYAFLPDCFTNATHKDPEPPLYSDLVIKNIDLTNRLNAAHETIDLDYQLASSREAELLDQIDRNKEHIKNLELSLESARTIIRENDKEIFRLTQKLGSIRKTVNG